MMNKKGQGMSINVVIIAAIALAVLVVLFAIFTGRLGRFSTGVSETEAQAFKCVCNAPGSSRVCSASPPASGASEITATSQGCGQWTDCGAPLKCYPTS